MKKRCVMIVLFVGFTTLLFAETNALIEVELFKTWVISTEWCYGGLTIENTGTEPFLLAKAAYDFEAGQLSTRSLDNQLSGPTDGGEYDGMYKEINLSGDGFEMLPVGEKKLYEGRQFLFQPRVPFSETMQFKVSVYLGNGFFLDSKPITVHGVTPDSEEYVATIRHNKFAREGKNKGPERELVAVTYRNERWLYQKSLPVPQLSLSRPLYYPVCPVSLKNKIRVEPYDDALLFKIWDGDKSMIFHMNKGMIMEGPDENDVLGKWTRDKKKEVQAHNDEVRRKKGGQ